MAGVASHRLVQNCVPDTSLYLSFNYQFSYTSVNILETHSPYYRDNINCDIDYSCDTIATATVDVRPQAKNWDKKMSFFSDMRQDLYLQDRYTTMQQYLLLFFLHWTGEATTVESVKLALKNQKLISITWHKPSSCKATLNPVALMDPQIPTYLSPVC